MSARPTLALALLLLACTMPARAGGGFAALVSPPRFELQAKAHGTVRELIRISNRAVTPSTLRIHTADFSLTPDYGVVFQDELAPGSCRPWVALERPEVVAAGRRDHPLPLRGQVPEGTAPGNAASAS